MLRLQWEGTGTVSAMTLPTESRASLGLKAHGKGGNSFELPLHACVHVRAREQREQRVGARLAYRTSKTIPTLPKESKALSGAASSGKGHKENPSHAFPQGEPTC